MKSNAAKQILTFRYLTVRQLGLLFAQWALSYSSEKAISAACCQGSPRSRFMETQHLALYSFEKITVVTVSGKNHKSFIITWTFSQSVFSCWGKKNKHFELEEDLCVITQHASFKQDWASKLIRAQCAREQFVKPLETFHLELSDPGASFPQVFPCQLEAGQHLQDVGAMSHKTFSSPQYGLAGTQRTKYHTFPSNAHGR